jgi:hypothetical protein
VGGHRNQRIVVNEQDHRRTIDGLRHVRRAVGFRRVGRDWQYQYCGSAFSHGAGEVQRATKLHGESVHHRQAKSSAFTERLRRKEGFDRSLQYFRRHAPAGVDYRKL